jgi:hypothetical protein
VDIGVGLGPDHGGLRTRDRGRRDKIANFDDFFRPLHNYFYWEPHCFDVPPCWALRSLFDALDGIAQLTDQLSNVSASITKLDELQPKPLALSLFCWTTGASNWDSRRGQSPDGGMASKPRRLFKRQRCQFGGGIVALGMFRADAPRSVRDDHRHVGGHRDVRDIRCDDTSRPFQ